MDKFRIGVPSAAIAATVVACRTPTQVTVELSTDVPCSADLTTSLRVGSSPEDLERHEPVVDTNQCEATGRIGSVVLTPSRSNDDSFVLKAILSHGGSTREQCQEADLASRPMAGCIVARRELRFVAHTELLLPIELRQSCDDVACGPRDTCVRGTCRPAVIVDPGLCRGDGCASSVLWPSDPGDGGQAESLDASTDASGDAGEAAGSIPDGGEVEGSTGPRLYVAFAQSIGNTVFPDDVVRIDISEGSAVVDATILGITAMAERKGSLLVARSYGYSRICVLDRDSLAILKTVLLPWDPDSVAFSGDGRYMYAGHGEGYVARLQVDDGQVTGDVQLPMQQDGASAKIVGLALDPTESRLVVVATDGALSTVAQLEVAGNVLTFVRQWSPPMFSDSNCAREPFTPIFDRTGARFATFDPNCSNFDIYDAASGSLDPSASVRFPRPDGVSYFENIVLDALGQVWTGNFYAVYRTGMMDSSRQAMFSFDPLGAPLLAINGSGDTIYAITNDPRANGIFTIDTASGARTQLALNLDRIPLGGIPMSATFVSR